MCLDVPDLEARTLATGSHLGFEWHIVHNGMGHRCGYIRVESGHPWFGLGIDDIDCSVHGGVTFAKHGTACPTHGPEAEWWIGFDTAHAFDRPDPALPGYFHDMDFLVRHPELDRGPLRHMVRSQEYVVSECEALCAQAAIRLIEANDAQITQPAS